jgi:hypothetical protein
LFFIDCKTRLLLHFAAARRFDRFANVHEATRKRIGTSEWIAFSTHK